MAVNFADVASKPLEEIERPPLPPVGTYRWRVTKLPETRKSNDEKWEFLTFNVKAIEALDDVDVTDYSGDVANITNRVQFIFNSEDEAEFEKTLFRVRTFLEKHLQVAEPGMKTNEAINASVNAEFLGTIAWRQDKNDPETFYAEIGRTAPVE